MTVTRERLREVLKRVKVGDKLQLTFKREEIEDLGYLHLMVVSGKNVQMSDTHLATLMAVGQSKKWGSDQNRIFEVVVLLGFDTEWFEQRLGRALEDVTIVGQ